MRRSRCNRLPARGTKVSPQATVPAFIETSLVPARGSLDAKQSVRRMASDMREAAYRDGGLTRDGLELLGYTPAQIDAHAADARRLANQQAGLT